MTERAVPFYCPYCGEEDIEPAGEEPGRFRCAACNRHWLLRFQGIGGRVTGSGDASAGDEGARRG